MSDQIIWICFEPINYPVPRILYGESDPNGDKNVYVPYVPAKRIEQLEKERKAMAMRDAGYDVFAGLEAKLAKAMEALMTAQEYINDLESHEGAEGFSLSTKVLGDSYHAALAEQEGK